MERHLHVGFQWVLWELANYCWFFLQRGELRELELEMLVIATLRIVGEALMERKVGHHKDTPKQTQTPGRGRKKDDLQE